MGVNRFTDLIAWQKARELTRMIYFVTGRGKFYKDFALRDQLRRASVSVMSNIAEGFGRAGKKEFHRYVVMAKGSCAEVLSQLYVAYDAGYIEQMTFDKLRNMTDEVGRILGGLRKSLVTNNE